MVTNMPQYRQERKPLVPQVSVIIPTYNCAHCLPRALQSVFGQSYTNFEVIVADDGSTDNVEAAIAPWRDRILYIRNDHAGVSAARNAAVHASTAPYIAFLDADDLWLPTKLERQLSILQADDSLGMVCADFSVHYEDGRLVESFFRNAQPIVNGDLFVRMVSDCFAPPSAVMVRRSALQQAGEFDTSLTVCEDLHLWLRIALRWKVAALYETVCVKHERSGARSHELAIASWIAALHKVLAAFPSMPAEKVRAVKRQIAMLQYDLGKYLLLRGSRREARQSFAGAMPWCPLSSALFYLLSFQPEGLIREMSRLKRRFA